MYVSIGDYFFSLPFKTLFPFPACLPANSNQRRVGFLKNPPVIPIRLLQQQQRRRRHPSASDFNDDDNGLFLSLSHLFSPLFYVDKNTLVIFRPCYCCWWPSPSSHPIRRRRHNNGKTATRTKFMPLARPSLPPPPSSPNFVTAYSSPNEQNRKSQGFCFFFKKKNLKS